MTTLSEIRARILAAPTSSAGDPDWLADAKVLLDVLDARGEPVWRPIESAPRDGTTFLAAVEVTSNKTGAAWWELHLVACDDETGDIHRDYDQGWSLDAYTHWMPLPAPPTDREKRLVEALTEIENAPNEMEDPDAKYMQLIAHDALEAYRDA